MGTGAQRKQNVKCKSHNSYTYSDRVKSDTIHKELYAYFQLAKQQLHSHLLKVHVLAAVVTSCQQHSSLAEESSAQQVEHDMFHINKKIQVFS